MIRTATKIYLLSSLLALGHPKEIALPAAPTSAHIGHLHVFADEGQTISLQVPGDEPVEAQLYRRAGTIVTPAGQPIAVLPSGHALTPIRIDFPRSDKPTRYTLVFLSENRPRLDITALPVNHLDRLREIARINPLVLAHPPEGLAACFQRLGVPIVIRDRTEAGKDEMLVVFATPPTELSPIKARRVVLVTPSILPEREIWVSKAPDQWRVTVPSRHFTPEVLRTADGQAKLIELLLGSPETIPPNNPS